VISTLKTAFSQYGKNIKKINVLSHAGEDETRFFFEEVCANIWNRNDDDARGIQNWLHYQSKQGTTTSSPMLIFYVGHTHSRAEDKRTSLCLEQT
jgi:hypothetical protein